MYTRTLGSFYVFVVISIILFGSKMWVVTPHIKCMLGGFHHRVVRRTPGNMPRIRTEGTWDYPPLGDTMREADIEEIETYISSQKNTVAQYIANCPILDLCMDTGMRTGSWIPKQWWE